MFIDQSHSVYLYCCGDGGHYGGGGWCHVCRDCEVGWGHHGGEGRVHGGGHQHGGEEGGKGRGVTGARISLAHITGEGWGEITGSGVQEFKS